MKTAIVLVLAMLTQAAGDTCLSMGMKSMGSLSRPDEFSVMMLVRAMETPTIWVGIFCLLLFFVLFSVCLSWADLSFVMPVLSFGYIVKVASAAFFLGETVSALRWAGTILIVVGVFLVSKSGTGPEDRGEAATGAGAPDRTVEESMRL